MKKTVISLLLILTHLLLATAILDGSLPAQALRPLRGARRGLAQRSGSCQPANQFLNQSQSLPLTAIAPLYQTDRGNLLALSTTQSAHPILWFYLPYALTPQRPAELRVEFPDPTAPSYRQQRTLLHLTQAAAGIIGVQLPATTMPLQPNQQYDFQLVVRCDLQDASASQFVDFSITRQPLSREIQQQVNRSRDRDRPRLYQNLGLWNEALSTLATLRQQNPQDAKLTAEWRTLLETLDLGAIANQPHSIPTLPP